MQGMRSLQNLYFETIILEDEAVCRRKVDIASFLFFAIFTGRKENRNKYHQQEGRSKMTNMEQTLEIDKLKEKLVELAYTDSAKQKIRELKPLLAENEVTAALRETTEARKIIEYAGNPPLTNLNSVKEYLTLAEQGGCLTAEQLEQIGVMLTTVRRLKDFLERAKQLEISLPYYEENLDSMDEVREEIGHMIRGGKVDDYASKELKSVRTEIERLEQKMREKADAILKANKNCMSDSFSTMRNGHICLPVKKECKFKIPGSVIDQSSTGSTLFIEPSGVSKYAAELDLKRLEEENEVRRILYTLTGMLADGAEILEINQRTIEKLDFAFAKGKISMEYQGAEPKITTDRRISIKNGRHPLMEKDSCVPLNFELGNGVQGVIITGPNTGGKTVAIKTVGMNCFMAQCGLHVSCEEAEICMNNQILCDIGDGQNISENLSTFSAHITNVLDILKKANRESLVIMDELGSGTDPTEGMGIAIAILEELRKVGALYLVTTHYPEVKNYAERTEGIINARMAFDRESLRPLYRLEIGKAGESCALYIAKKLGMPGNMLQCASEAAYGTAERIMPDIDVSEEIQHERVAGIKKKKEPKTEKNLAEKFHRGDSVMVYPDKKIGIVCEPVNEKGVLRVQLPNKKIWINHKRVKLHVAATELYPEDYDFSIIFDTVEQRKARHRMERKYAPEIELHIEKEDTYGKIS